METLAVSHSLSKLSSVSSRGEFYGRHVDMQTRRSPQSVALPKIQMAISKEKKKLTVEKAKQELENCTMIASINYQRFTVKQFQDLRRKLPEGTSLYVCKNKLLGKAIEGTPFAALEPAMKGMNAFLFVHTEEIPAALKPYRDMQKELKLEVNDYTGAVFEGKFYGPEDFKSLESMPTRLELYAKLLGTLKAPSTKIVSLIQAPARDLVFTLKAYVKKLEEEQGESS